MRYEDGDVRMEKPTVFFTDIIITCEDVFALKIETH